MGEMERFLHPEYGKVRTLLEGDEIWFVGKDLALALGYHNTKDALLRHVDPEDRKVRKRSESTTFEIPSRGITVVNESGMYSLVLSSQRPKAKAFRRWVTKEVLPQIRRKGRYESVEGMKALVEDPLFVEALLSQVHQLQQWRGEREEQIQVLEQKELYYDTMMDSNYSLNFRTTAKELEIKPLYLTAMLVDRGYLYRNGKGELLPYQRYLEAGYFKVIEFCSKAGHHGIQTLVCPKGREHLLQLRREGSMGDGR